MHGTHDYLTGLAQIHTRESVEERRALWRQGLASLAAAASGVFERPTVRAAWSRLIGDRESLV